MGAHLYLRPTLDIRDPACLRNSMAIFTLLNAGSKLKNINGFKEPNLHFVTEPKRRNVEDFTCVALNRYLSAYLQLH